MKICIICYYFYPLSAGGGKQMLGLAQALRDKGHDVLFISADFGKFPKEDSIDGFRLIRVSSTGRGTVDLFRYWLNLSKTLIKNRSNYDVILTCELSLYNIIIGCVGKMLGKKTVGRTSMSGEVESRSYGHLFGLVHRLFLICLDEYIAINKTLLIDLCSIKGIDRNNVNLIYNGVDTQKYSPADAIEKNRLKEKLGFDNQLIVLYVGIIDPRKGVHDLIDAWSMIVDHRNDAKLVIVGPMYEEENTSWDHGYYQFILDKLNVLNTYKTKLVGKKDNVSEYMMSADIFVLPSYREGMPNVILEAMASGLPVVCTDIHGCIDLIDDAVNGYLFRPGDFDAAAKLINSLLDSKATREKMGGISFDKIISKHNFDYVADKYLEVFRAR